MTIHTISRRDVIRNSAALGIAALATPLGLPALAAAPEHLPGIQLYTVRDSMATDVPGTLRAIAGIGYREVEFAGYGDQSAQQVRRLLDDLALRAPSSHVDARVLRQDPQPLIDMAGEIGHEYLTVAWLRAEDRQTIDDYKRWADIFNRVAEACRKSGLRLSYHNHDFEFQLLDGQLPFDILLNETDPHLMDFELDFFWVRKGGEDIVTVLNYAPERFTMAHIKDMDAQGNMADVGAGVINFKDILRNPAASGLRHFFVEHDNPPDPFKSAAISHLALASILS
jgi:sugar phosphate isomerase/epimerase